MAATLNYQRKSLLLWRFHLLKRWNSLRGWSLTGVVVMETRCDAFFIFKTGKMDLLVLLNVTSQDRKTEVGLSNVPQCSWPALRHPLRKRRRADLSEPSGWVDKCEFQRFWSGAFWTLLQAEGGEPWGVWSVCRCAASALEASELWLEDFLLVSWSRRHL